MEADAQNLAEGEVPRLEREIDQSIQNAEGFITSENPDEEVLSEIEKEYARRLERQPVDVVQQNAERYENDYQTAENRNATACARPSRPTPCATTSATTTRTTQHATRLNAKNSSTPNFRNSKPKSPPARPG